MYFTREKLRLRKVWVSKLKVLYFVTKSLNGFFRQMKSIFQFGQHSGDLATENNLFK